jgi:glycosyltransferase involved in cell wall biosynthesis
MIISILLKVVLITVVPTVIVSIIGISLYDFKRLKQASQVRLHPYKKEFKKRRLITVLVETKNSQQTIEACLLSLIKSPYKNMEIVIADNASNDDTRKIIKQIIADYPKKTIKLYSKRKESDSLNLLKYAFKKYIHGELVLTLSPDAVIDKKTLKAINLQFALESLEVLKLNRLVLPSLNSTKVFQEFNNILRNCQLKASLGLTKKRVLKLLSNQVYTYDAFKSILNGSEYTNLITSYNSNVAIYETSKSLLEMFKLKMHTNYQFSLPLISDLTLNYSAKDYVDSALSGLYKLFIGLTCVMVPVAFGFFIYLSISLSQPNFLAIAWSGLILGLIYAISEYDGVPLLTKLRLASLSPIALYWLYLNSLIYLICMPFKAVLGLKDLAY